LLGIIYAILIGFTILFELGAFDKAENSSNTEGRILYSIYHNTKNLPGLGASKIRNQVVKYAENVIDNEWPAMDSGNKVDSKGIVIIENIQKEIRSYNLSKLNNTIAINALNNIAMATNTLYDLHQERTLEIHTTLNNHIWFVLLLASILTLGVNYILGMEYRLHILCVTLISIMIATIIFLIVGLDRPYQGDLSVHPKTFISTLEYIRNDLSNDLTQEHPKGGGRLPHQVASSFM
jgi:hypothetical protein